MNITELKAAVDGALEAGLHPGTEVVFAHDGWYHTFEDVEHPLDGRQDEHGCGLWFTMNPRVVVDDGREVYDACDARLTPGHEVQPDPVLFAEYTGDVEESRDPESVLYGTPVGYYPEWLQDRYEGLAGALRDDPPRDNAELADVYHSLAMYLQELERMS